MPRALCHYRRIDLAALPARQRLAAARLQAQRHEPGPGALLFLAWTGGVAHCWTWPRPEPRVAQQLEGWIPETLLRAPPAADGARLLQQQVGVEGQLWRDGQLQSSQWWPERPQADAWRRYLRAGGLPSAATEAVPEPEALPWLASPWGDVRRGLPGSPAARERTAWVATACILALGLGWQLLAQAHWAAALARVDARVETLRAQATPLLEARERADTALAQLQDLRTLQQGVSDYRLMAEVLRPLPAEVRLASWQRENSRLRASLMGAQPDPRPYVSAYQADPVLADVTATPEGDRGVMRLDFTLAPAPAPAPAPDPVADAAPAEGDGAAAAGDAGPATPAAGAGPAPAGPAAQ